MPDTILIGNTSREVILHPCPHPITVEDIWLVAIIGIIIIVGLWIIGYYVSKSVTSVQDAKLKELNSRQAHELAKIEKEAEKKHAIDAFNAEQTNKKREWLSEADRIKNDEDRLNLRLKEAQINEKIKNIGKNDDSLKAQIQS